ncbi:hypothetical protein CH294_06560 [Rhodococcus sp. 14-2483-1-1]|uniref:DUF6924 domain-containing protein n=1 Tax=Rhodococcus sp. 14-2483-1-1 TaxID=2023148 RepID=UPI000B9BB194|nr:hypothetical protein [Rhodococcus sp. 14-2483-1-1]OZF39148.1 hypothetical protein CH294_06560 [Rhodococcus sp. 14-2483-1-1]
MAPKWEQVRASNYGTMGRTIRGVVHRSDGSRQLVRHEPDTTSWRLEDESGDPTFIENADNRWSRGADGVMVHAVKNANTFYMDMGSPAPLLRAYDMFPPRSNHGFGDSRFTDPTAPQQVTVRDRDGWEVEATDPHSTERITYVIDAELGVALRWQYGDQWMELENPVLDEEFDADLFRWSGPSHQADDDMARMQRDQQEREQALASIARAVPTWLPTTITTTPQSGDPRTGELILAVEGHTAYFTLRRWVTAIGEPEVTWPNDQTPALHRQSVGEWTYEIRSYQEMRPEDCERIIDSIVPVDPPNRSAAGIAAEIAAEERDRREAEITDMLGTGRALADHLTGESLLIRTDFSDDSAWREIALAAMAPVDQGNDMEFEAVLTCIDNRDHDGWSVTQLLQALGDSPPYYVFVVDTETVHNPEHPIAVVDTGVDDPERHGKTFRTVPSEMWSIENNLSIANMDFDDFAGSADEDGVFRGFPEPARPVEQVTTQDVAGWIADDLHTDTLRRFHREIDGWKYPYPIALFEAEMAEVHTQLLAADYDSRTDTELVGHDEFGEVAARGGPALHGGVPVSGAYWSFLLDMESRRPLAAYRLEFLPPTDQPVQDSDASSSAVVEVPFISNEMVSLSSLTDDDDLVDRDAVRRAVAAEAVRLHGPDMVGSVEPALMRIPRLEGFSIGCSVQIGGKPMFYVAVVTAVDNEFIIREVPPEGLRVVATRHDQK